MDRILQKMADCINSADCGIIAELGYKTEFIERPVLSKAVYFIADEIRFNEMDFSALVYSPIADKGSGCIDSAKSVCKILKSSGFNMSGCKIIGVEYNNDSQALVSRIRGTVSVEDLGDNGEADNITEILGGVRVSAFGFSRNTSVTSYFKAESAEITCEYNNYAVSVIFTGEPLDIIDGEIVYKITLKGISEQTAEILSENGYFSMSISSGEKWLRFNKCSCEKLVLSGTSKGNLIIKAQSTT